MIEEKIFRDLSEICEVWGCSVHCVFLQNAEIASSIIRIPSPAPPKEWVALSAAAKSKGGAAVINSLTNQRLVVPDVEHAAGGAFLEDIACLPLFP